MSTLNHAETYATRAGSILALSHLLSATDLHADNIIASTVGPVVVDLETIFMPELLLSPCKTKLESLLNESLLRTKLLPEWDPNYSGEVVDVSGFAGLNDTDQDYLVICPKNVNSDAMYLSHERSRVSPSLNRIVIGNQLLPLGCFHKQIRKGFIDAYSLILCRRDEFVESMRKFCDNSLAGDQKHVSVRFLFRPTLVYDQLADLCCLPDYLGDSAALAMERDCLMQSFDFEIQGASILHLLLEERRSIDQGDVPRFMVDLDSRSLTLNGIKIVDRDCLDLFLLDCSPWELS